jgi:hypothetical protein
MREFFAQGMLCNVMAAIDLKSVDEPWAQSFFDEDEAKREALLAMGATLDTSESAALPHSA